MSTLDPRSARTTSARSLAILGLFVVAMAVSACAGAGVFQNVGDNLQGGGNPVPGEEAGGGGR